MGADAPLPCGSRLPSSPVLGHRARCEKLYQQLSFRLGAPLIREVLATFRAGDLTATAGAQALEIGRTRFYQLYADYLRACAARTQRRWVPGVASRSMVNEFWLCISTRIALKMKTT